MTAHNGQEAIDVLDPRVLLHDSSTPRQEAISAIDALVFEARRFRGSYESRRRLRFRRVLRLSPPYTPTVARIQPRSASKVAPGARWLGPSGRDITPAGRAIMIL